MSRRSVPEEIRLRVVSSDGERAIDPSCPERDDGSDTGEGPGGDRHLTLVLGLDAAVDGRRARCGDLSQRTRRDIDAERRMTVNMKLRDASISAIEAAQVYSEACFCPSHEAAVLDTILCVIDQLDEVIRALHTHGRPVPFVAHAAEAPSSMRTVFVPAGRGSILRMATSRTGSGQTSGGGVMKAEDADQFLAELIGGSEDELPSLTTICRSASRMLRMSGASVVLMGEGTFPSVVGAYGVPLAVQDLEFTLGEGPASDAYAEGKPVLVGDVGSSSSLWPQFTRAVAREGMQSIYAIPLRLGAIRLGVLVLYRDGPGVFEGKELAAALLVAELVANQVLDMQAGAMSETLAWGLEVDDYRAVVHQATGMISVQLGCAIGEALARLRGRAFASEQPIDQLATDVVTGQLRFDEP
jgi:GAF domain-containing protein